MHLNSLRFPTVFTTFSIEGASNAISLSSSSTLPHYPPYCTQHVVTLYFYRRDLNNHFSAQNSPTFGACKIVKIYPRHFKLWNLTFQTLYSMSTGKNVASSGFCKFRRIVWIPPSITSCIRTILYPLRCAINKGWWEATSSIQLFPSFDFVQGKPHKPGFINSCLFLAVSRNAWPVVKTLVSCRVNTAFNNFHISARCSRVTRPKLFVYTTL